MIFNLVTLFPEMLDQMFTEGVVGTARTKELIRFNLVNPRSFTANVHHTVDDRPFGGGDGMVLLEGPWAEAVHQAQALCATSTSWVVALTPQGRKLDDQVVRELAARPALTLVCGRYAGFDQRFLNTHVDEEISIGDYVLSGGELAAGVVIDAVARQIPGVLGHHQSAELESFRTGLLEGPLYTRPREADSGCVPEILLSGHQKKIEVWRHLIAQLFTLRRRPDLLDWAALSASEQRALREVVVGLSAADRKALGFPDDIDFESYFVRRDS